MDNIFGLNGSYQFYIAQDFVHPFVRPNKRIDCVVKCDDTDIQLVIDKVVDSFGKDTQVKYTLDGCVYQCKIEDLTCFEQLLILGEENIVLRKRFDLSDLEELMKRLRAKDGCEWDKAQNHLSLRGNLIEEAYELLEGIDEQNKDMMIEEAGDVLLQSVFHTEIAEEEGDFNWTDMLTVLCRKLLDRHTHIFGENHAYNAEEALAFWSEAKKKEKKYKSNSDAMNRVPKNFPSLLYAEKIQKIAKKCGFDWNSVDGAVDKVNEELSELLSALPEDRDEEGGDLLFAVVNVLRFFKVDPEIALHDANRKFFKRFCEVERLATENGKDMKDYTLDELDAFWNIAKQNCKDN